MVIKMCMDTQDHTLKQILCSELQYGLGECHTVSIRVELLISWKGKAESEKQLV